MLETRTRLQRSMPASRSANSNEVSLRPATPTPRVRKTLRGIKMPGSSAGMARPTNGSDDMAHSPFAWYPGPSARRIAEALGAPASGRPASDHAEQNETHEGEVEEPTGEQRPDSYAAGDAQAEPQKRARGQSQPGGEQPVTSRVATA